MSYAGAYETAYHALVRCGRVQQGQFCSLIELDRNKNFFLGEIALIHGATGATGLAAVQVKAPWEDVKRGRKSQMPDGEMTDSRENIQNSYVQLLMLVVMISILEPK